jgi:hypothetical protein
MQMMARRWTGKSWRQPGSAGVLPVVGRRITFLSDFNVLEASGTGLQVPCKLPGSDSIVLILTPVKAKLQLSVGR